MQPPWNSEIKFMYVRQAYRDLHEKIASHAQNHIIITGTPGIGKSFFALYELYKAVTEDKVVVFQHLPAHLIYVFANNEGLSAPLIGDCEEWLSSEDTVYLYDAGTNISPNHMLRKAKIRVFSSPNNQNYSEIWKTTSSLKFYMPVWSWPEIECLERKSEVNMDIVEKMYDIFGGVPRHLFHISADKRDQVVWDLDSKCAQIEVTDILKNIEESTATECHRIFHYNTDDNYTKSGTDFASPYVEEKIYESLSKQKEENLYRFLLKSAATPDVAVIRGKMFERLCHRLLPQGGEFTIRKLGMTNGTPTDLQKRTSTSFHDLSELKPDHYMVPSSKRFPSVDAIVPPDIGYQMTVSKHHPLNVNGINDVMDACGCRSLRLYFVIPKDIFDDFPMQGYKKGTLHAAVEQYALCINLDEVL